MNRKALEERLARYAHEAWSGWMVHVFSKRLLSIETACGVVFLPGAYLPNAWVKRWRRQMETPYLELHELEKESDRKEARKMMEIVDEHIHSEVKAIARREIAKIKELEEELEEKLKRLARVNPIADDARNDVRGKIKEIKFALSVLKEVVGIGE